MTEADTTDALASLAAQVRELRVHDASPLIGPALEVFFPNPAPVRKTFADHASHGVAANVWEIHEHSGSHVDAPYHFDALGPSMEEVPVDALFLRPFKKYDLSTRHLEPGNPAALEDLKAAEQRAGFTLAPGDVAIIDFGYDQYLPSGEEPREPGWWGRNEPGMDEQACEYLASCKITAVGSDTSACDFSIRDGEMSAGSGHGKHFLPNGILIIEGLAGLSAVSSTGLLVALPLKLERGTGSPLRVLLLSEPS